MTSTGGGTDPDPGTAPASSSTPDGWATLRAEFDAPRGYLDAATLGLPARSTVGALTAALAQWQAGRATAAGYDEQVRTARAAYARLAGVGDVDVAVGSQVSAMVAPVAAAVPDGGRVVVVAEDFASLQFPFLVHRDRGVEVRQVPLGSLAEAVGPRTDVVAFSLVQSADGRLADADAVLAACREHDVLTVCDVTQAAGWLPVDAGRFDVTVCGAYKWLCAPRGVGLTTLSARARERIRPVQAGWYAGERPWDSVYGPAMHLAGEARRFDVSPAWLPWAGAAAVLPLFAAADPAALRDHGVGLAARLRATLGLPETGSPVVAVTDRGPGRDGRDDAARLVAAGVRAARRAGRLRVAFHVWNDEDDLDLVTDLLTR